MKVHPFAARFPMLGMIELEKLAEDIEQHGLVHKPVIWKRTGQLLDGRNRLAAMELCGIKPEYIEWDGDNPEAFILSVNVHRRHIPKGTQAMAVALAYPEAKHGGKREKGKSQVMSHNLTGDQIHKARTVIKEFGDSSIVQAVMNGGSLEQAYELALSQRETRKLHERQLNELREEFPDFAKNVDDKIWSLELALQRAKSEREFLERSKLTKDDEKQTVELTNELIQEHPIEYNGKVTDTSKYQVSPELGETIDRMKSRIPPYLKDQKEIVGTLLGTVRSLESLHKKPIPPSNSVDQSFFAGVLSGVSQIIELSKRIGDSYLAELRRQDNKIRKIK